jgi:type VI secretion system protein ImpJ
MNRNNSQQHGPLPLSVCWHEGMLLSPQHFQQNHIFWESQLQTLVQYTAPYRWGVLNMRLDEGRLLDGEVYFTELRAIMPDGLQIDYQEIDTTSAGRPTLQLDLNNCEELWDSGKVKVQLTVPIRLPGSASSKADVQRFEVIDSDPVKDDNTGEGEAELQRLLPIMSLQATQNVSKQYISLPLFEIILNEGPQYRISGYCPPMLNLAADNFLMSELPASIPGEQQEQTPLIQGELNRIPLQRRLQKMALAIRKKTKQLAGFSEDGDEQFGLRVTEQHRLWIRAMAQHLTEFELLTDNSICSPWDIY